MPDLRAKLLALTLLVFLALSCGGDEEEAPKQADGAQLLADAVAAVQGASSFHFTLDHENGTTAMPLNLELVSAEGDVVVPDRLAAAVRARAAGIAVAIDVIGIGDDTWVTNPFTRRWESLPGATIADFTDPAGLVVAVVRQMEEVQVEGQEQLNGTTAYRLAGRLDSGALAGTLPGVQPGLPLQVEVWLATADLLPLRARISGPLSATESGDIVRQMDFSRFNAAVTITPPQ